MNICIFGLTITSSWGNGHATPYRALIRALARMGHHVHFFEKDVPYYNARRDFETCDYSRITIYPEWSFIRKQALATANSADVVVTASFLPDGARINDELLSLARPVRVYYDLDTPVTLKKLLHGPLEYLRADQIAGFDVVLSFTGGQALTVLKNRYEAQAVHALYGCVDPDDYRRTQSNSQWGCDLSYMGTYSPDRQEKLNQLLLEPARRHPEKTFLLAGPLYPWQCQWPANVRRLDHIPPADHPGFYSSSRLTLNLTRGEMAENGWCPSGRFFEASACGAPLITDTWDGLDAFFDVERDLRIVCTAEDMEDALSLPDAELARMAAHARQRTLEEHTGQVRARQFLQILDTACSKYTTQPANEVAQ